MVPGADARAVRDLGDRGAVEPALDEQLERRFHDPSRLSPRCPVSSPRARAVSAPRTCPRSSPGACSVWLATVDPLRSPRVCRLVPPEERAVLPAAGAPAAPAATAAPVTGRRSGRRAALGLVGIARNEYSFRGDVQGLFCRDCRNVRDLDGMREITSRRSTSGPTGRSDARCRGRRRSRTGG